MRIQPKRSNKAALLLLVLLILWLPGIALAKEPKLIFTAHPLAWGGSCEPGFLKVIAGTRFFLTIRNTAEQQPQTPAPGWPEGYVLEAALDLPEGQPFLATPGLIELMGPTRFLSAVNRFWAKGMLTQPSATIDLDGLNQKNFELTIPANLAGHTVDFRARYEANGLSLISQSTGPIRIIVPCDRSDTARVVATLIYEAWNIGDYPRAIELADSMLVTGLSDAAGWWLAESIARGMEQYDKAMTYLQRMYEDFGVMEIELNTDRPPRLNRGGVRDARLEHAYQSARNKYLRLKAEQEQQ